MSHHQQSQLQPQIQEHQQQLSPPSQISASSLTETPATTTTTTTTATSTIDQQNHVQLLMNALEKLDPDKNGLSLVPKEITSSTLTTRLRGVCKINRLVDHSNDLCHSFNEIGAQAKFQESANKFRDWILQNKIIEHIFGPNCHVEIIKQSHTILNFVAYSLDDGHVNVIWSASLLKHCGRQVLDLLTSLIRFMRTGPVLHLYWLVKNLNIEDHSEHTLLLTSHILRFIWSHSPCINQIQFCALQKNRQQQLAQDGADLENLDLESKQQFLSHLTKRKSPRHSQQYGQNQHHSRHLPSLHHNHPHHNNQQEQHQNHTQPKQHSSQYQTFGQHSHAHPNSPVGDTLAKGGGDGHQPADDVKKSVVDHILRSISAGSPEGSQSSSQPKQLMTDFVETNEPSQCNSDSEDVHEREWLRSWKGGNDFLDNTSDVSACCSEDKNMGDFDDDAQDFIQDENTNGTDGPSANSSSSDMYIGEICQNDSPRGDSLNTSSRSINRELIDSISSSRDSEPNNRISLEHNNSDHFEASIESVDHFLELKKASLNLSSITGQICADDDLKGLSEYNLANLSDPGKTLLWDLLQDGKIEHLAANLNVEVENVLVNLVMSFGDRYIRYKFIEACLENLSVGTSVIISLRLLPKLMTLSTMTRGPSIPAINETYSIVLWAEREHNMSKNFFKNLVEYHKQRQQNLKAKYHDDMDESNESGGKNPMFTHIDTIITRMSFLTFIYSKPFSPVTMKLNQEQMDQLWDCLASDSQLRCSDVLFQWIFQQAVGEDFHGVDDDLINYVLKHKLPTLASEHFRLRGLKLLEQLLWIRQDYECCHELEHPATRLLWDIGLKAVDDEVSMAAIRMLNHFYIYTNHQKPLTCKKGTNFMQYCMEHLQSSLASLKSTSEQKQTNQSLDVLQRVILLIRTHLEVFKAHWSYYLRILQLNNEADLISHRLSAYDIKLPMTIRIVCQAASNMQKTTIEVQANDFIGELRAEIVKWWYSQVDRSQFGQSSSFSPQSSTSSTTSLHVREETEDLLTSRQASHGSGEFKPIAKGSLHQLDSFTAFLLTNRHSLRLLILNQEIPFDWDERQINELDFKDMQVVYVLNDSKPANNVDSADDLNSEKSEESPHAVYYPKPSSIPSIVLQNQECFELLMEVDKFLGSFQSDNIELTNRAKTLSRRVWEIIQILPTCPHYKDDLKRCGIEEEEWNLKVGRCANLLSAECPQRLLYSLQIIDILKSSHECPFWGSTFIRKGGLADLYDVFMSQKLLPVDNEDWNEWLQECLAYFLKLLFQFGTKITQSPTNTDCSSSSSSSKISIGGSGGQCSNRVGTMGSNVGSIKRVRRNRGRFIGTVEERIPIPQFSEELLKLLADTDLIFNKLIRILKSSALCRGQNDQYYYVSMSSRAMIVHHVMSFLSSWCKSDIKFPNIKMEDHEQLLKALILDDPDSSIRREACNGFFKLHYACVTRTLESSLISHNSTMATPSDSFNTDGHVSDSSIVCDSSNQIPNLNFSSDLLACLIKFLPIAEAMRPPRSIRNYLSETEYIRDLNSPGCKDYFWLTCRLIDAPTACERRHLSPPKQQEHTTATNENTSPDFLKHPSAPHVSSPCPSNIESGVSYSLSAINLFKLCEYLVAAIRRRQTYETRDHTVEDDALRGMLMMMVMALRRDPTFKYTEMAHQFVLELYGYLFAPPTERFRFFPKCKSPPTRSTAFDLMIALVERCPRNYLRLLKQLLSDQHQAVVKGSYPTDYWPHDDCRSEFGFVGLINLGATCYLATCMQHLFMIPDLRYAILSIEDTKSIRHGDIIRELQKIFVCMLESERKAFNPRNFCKVYTMDNHPLNIAEQTDMTEFLTDLMTKLEESSPGLRHIIKSLFSGTLSNNVVSLDCPHISRTTEEFYTLRVQVADMRNLNDSLDELTVKDTLEGDNMYTCSTCEKKVRAEKRACIVKLPRILCFNTMRYTFNMATMTKEKVNTHFSFPLKLDMADYLETNLMKRQQSSSSNAGSCSSKGSSTENIVGGQRGTSKSPDSCSSSRNQSATSNQSTDEYDSDTIYELIGVTVHTGNADGGHYYCFIRDCEDHMADKPRWYLFNDAEVKPFDDSHIGTECYGGELTTKSYDALNERFMDFSIEKTNSAYMLFYKRVDYKFRSKSVALRYLESDTERNIVNEMGASNAQHMQFDNGDMEDQDEEVEEEEEEDEEGDIDVQMKKETDSSSEMDVEHDPTSELDSNKLDVVSECRPTKLKPASRSTNGANSSLQHGPVDAATTIAATTRDSTAYANSMLAGGLNFDKLCKMTYEDFKLPRHLASWVWNDNLKFARDRYIFEHNYFNFMWQICANIPRTLNQIPDNLMDIIEPSEIMVADDTISIETVHLAITFVLGVLMNSRERPNLSNWTELIRKQFNSSKAACDWLMQLIDDEETWLKQMLLKCPIEMVRQLFQRLCNDLTGSKQHKKLRLIK